MSMPNLTFYCSEDYYKKLNKLGELVKKLEKKEGDRKKDATMGLLYLEKYVDQSIEDVKKALNNGSVPQN